MAAGVVNTVENEDSLASLERLKQVETDGDAQLRMVRGKIDLTLSQLRDDSEALLLRAQNNADAEAARILAEAKAALDQRAQAGLPDWGKVWPDILNVLFGEFS
jgi:hypothetical protein